MMAYAVRALHESHGKKYLTDVRTPANEIFKNNPFITRIADDDPDAQLIKMEYPSINQSCDYPVHFANAFSSFLSDKLKVKIYSTLLLNFELNFCLLTFEFWLKDLQFAAIMYLGVSLYGNLNFAFRISKCINVSFIMLVD